MRGIRSLLQKSAPGKLAGSGKFACFRARSASTNRPVGPKLKGITKLLTKRVYSSARPPSVAGWRGGAWQGQGGGLRRGKAVDAQVSRLAKASVAARKTSKMLKLTRLTFNALAYHGLVPVDAQRVVIDRSRGIGTAVDVVCTRGDHELVLVELKTGFGGDRTKSAGAFMQKPIVKAKDSNVNRHFAQLAVTIHLFKQEESTLAKLKSKGIDLVSGCILYVDGDLSEKFDLPSWWEKRGARIIARISK
tara:strand:+ start:316 stop:1059 length:744 start_codon:yes stop_codon:yes gene_type:complete